MEITGDEENTEKRGPFRALVFIVIFIIAIAIAGVIFVRIEHETPPLPKETIEVTHDFEGGEHTLNGIISLPTPCYKVEADALVLESYPEKVTVRIRTLPENSICVQVITEKNFSISFQASEEAIISATLDGVDVNLEISETSGNTTPTTTNVE